MKINAPKYKSRDGKYFATEEDYLKHELSLAFCKWYDEHPLFDGSYDTVDDVCVMEWLDENRDFILMYLNKGGKMITDYEVVVGSNENDLCISVMSFVEEGYEPIGGVAVCVSQGNYTAYYQAMIKREEKTSL